MIDHTTCPTCGSERIRKVKRTLKRESRGKAYSVPNVTFYECPDCGEQIFGPEAMDKIEAARRKRGDAAA